MKKIYAIALALCGMIATTGKAQTYLLEDFDNPFTGTPAAPSGWAQNRVVLIGDGNPEANGANGEKDWQQNVNTGPSTWTIPAGLGLSPTSAVTGTGALWMQDAYFGSTTNAFGSRRMQSPTVNLSTSTNPYVRFYYFCGYAPTVFNVRVVASNDGGTTWNSIMIIPPNAGVTAAMTNATPWQKINVLIPAAYRVANAKFGIEMTNTWGTQNIFIDNFRVEEFTPTTITSAQTGLWSATTTWVGGIVPDCDNNVVIATGHTVSIDVNIARCQNVTVDGTLNYSTATSMFLHAFGDLTINVGGTYNAYFGTTGKRTFLGGSLTNNGTVDFSVGANLLFWLGGAPATFSNTGVIVNGFIGNLWHTNSAGVTYNSPCEVRNACGLYVGAVNPNGMLTVGNALVTTQTVERAVGYFTQAPLWGAGVTRSVSYISTAMSPLQQQIVMQGEEMRLVGSARVAEGTFTINTHNNVQLTAPTIVGTTTAGSLVLTRGIIITTFTNLLTLNNIIAGPVGVTPSVVTGTGTNATTHGSYIAGPMRINFPGSGTTTRNFAFGAGTAFNNNLPSTNALRLVSLLAGTTAWANQTITMSIESAPSGLVNPPLSVVFGTRAYRMQLNGGPSLSATASIQMRFNNSTFGGSDNLAGNLQDIRIAQSSSLTGSWSERSLTSGTGPILNNVLYGYISATVVPGPINTGEEYFAWASVGPTLDMLALQLVAPTSSCFGTNQTVTVRVRNNGVATINFATNNVTINSSVTGPNPQIFGPVVLNTGTLAPNATQDVVVSTTYDMTLPGSYVFNASTTLVSDQNTSNDAMTPVTVISQNPTVNAGSDVTICNGSSTVLNANGMANGVMNIFNTTDVVVPDNNPTGAQSTMNATSPANANQLVAVIIDSVAMTWDGDLAFTLIAPNASQIPLITNRGGSGDNFINTVLTTTGPPISSGVAPFTGIFQPEQPFTNLTGSANGTWTLRIVDNAGGDIATLQRWTLSLPNSIASYAWSPAAGLSSTTVANPTANPTITTTYTVVVTDANGCTATDMITVTVNPTPVVSLGADYSICSGDTTTLDAGNPGETYLWSTAATTQTIDVTNAGTYYVTVTNSFSCSNADTITIGVNALPVFNIGNDTTFCMGGSVVYDAGSGFTSYLWSTSATTQAITANSTGSYIATVTDVNGCSNSDTAMVTVNALPVVSLGADQAICSGDSTLLDAGSGFSSYLWSTSASTQTIYVNSGGNYSVSVTDANGCSNSDTVAISINALPVVMLGADTTQCGGSVLLDAQNPGSSYLWSTTATTQTISVNTTGSYNVTVTDLNGCSSSDTINVTINTVPVVALGSDITQCGDSVTLDAQNPGATYLWSTSATTQTITVGTTGTYMVTVTNGFGCNNSDTINITINPVPVPDAGADTTICFGNSVTLAADSGYVAYLWQFGQVSSNQQFITVAPNDTTTYYLTVTNSFGCTGTDSVVVNVAPQPVASFTVTMVNGYTYTFTNTSTGSQPMTITWNFGDGSPLDNTPNPTHVYTANGTYTVLLTIQTPCGIDQVIQTVVVTGVGISESVSSINIELFPNPTSGQFTISIENSGADDIAIEISDMEGRKVMALSDKVNGSIYEQQFDISNFANGVYYIKVISGSEMKIEKLVLQQ